MADPDYFTLEEFRALPDMDDEATYTDADIEAEAAYFTAIVERELGYPLVPRTVVDTLDGCGWTLVLSQAYVRSLTSVTVDGSTVSTALLTANSGVVRYLNGSTWSAAAPANVVVTYSAGRYVTCPADIKSPVMWAVRDRLLSHADNAGIDIRKTSVTTEFGTTSYVLPGENRPTGFPELDAAIAGRERSSTSFGFA